MAVPDGESVVTGILAGVMPKTNRNNEPTGFYAFEILQPGNQYPDKFETGVQEIITAALALLGQNVTAQVNVFDSNTPNPHRAGTFYKNRYLNAIGPAGVGAPAMGTPVPQPQMVPQQGMAAAQPMVPAPQVPAMQAAAPVDPFTPEPRDLKIYRQVAWKSAVEFVIAGEIPFAPVPMVEHAEVVMGYLRYGPARFGVASHEQQTQQQTQPQTMPTGDPGSDAPPADDEIPF